MWAGTGRPGIARQQVKATPRDAHVNGRHPVFRNKYRLHIALVVASKSSLNPGTLDPPRGRGDPFLCLRGLQTTFPRRLRGLVLLRSSAYYISQKELRQPRPGYTESIVAPGVLCGCQRGLYFPGTSAAAPAGSSGLVACPSFGSKARD